jgi:para-nitrobenzyl esterase
LAARRWKAFRQVQAMSGAEGWSRRAALGGGFAAAAIALIPQAKAQDFIVAWQRVLTPDGEYRSRSWSSEWHPDHPPSVLAFCGIKYASAERFGPPVPLRVALQIAAAQFSPVAPQQGNRYQPQSEDCLYLNVWKANKAGRSTRPVMVYFHGGAYSTGSVTDPLNDGAKLAERGDMVVVTVNHRLNALGYLYLPERFPDSGNNGQLDLICALQWVQRNIAAFGGDPGNVTVFGQSGGGAKIATLMAMPAAKGLFHKAITMSGQQVTASGPLNARKRAQVFLDKLGGADPATAPVDQLIAALSATDPILGGGVYMGPVLDMRNLHRHPFWPDAAPQSLGIPMMLGNCVAETRAFFAPDGRQLKGLDWSNLAVRAAPEMKVDIDPQWVVEQFRSRYPAASPLEQFHRIVTAARSWRGQVEEAEARARAGRHNTFVYQLDFEQAKHTDDIGLSFGTFENPTPARQAMSDRMMDAFVRFARTGNPGWSPYDLKSRKTMVFDMVSREVSNPRQWERELFARVPYIQPGS